MNTPNKKFCVESFYVDEDDTKFYREFFDTKEEAELYLYLENRSNKFTGSRILELKLEEVYK